MSIYDPNRAPTSDAPRHDADMAAWARSLSRQKARKDGDRVEVLADLLVDVAAAERGIWAEARALRDDWASTAEAAWRRLTGRIEATRFLGTIFQVTIAIVYLWLAVGLFTFFAVPLASLLFDFQPEPLRPYMRWVVGPVLAAVFGSMALRGGALAAALAVAAVRPEVVRIVRAHDDRTALANRLARYYTQEDLQSAHAALTADAAHVSGAKTLAEGSAASVAAVFALIGALRGDSPDTALSATAATFALFFAWRVRRALHRARKAAQARDAVAAALAIPKPLES
jgi:hypothetical protein